MFYVYILKNEISEIYFGSTNDLCRRIKEHNSGKSFSTKGHRWTLVYYEAFLSEDKMKTFFHGHSFTANPLACVASLASMDLLHEAETQAAIKMIERNHILFVMSLKVYFEILKDVR